MNHESTCNNCSVAVSDNGTLPCFFLYLKKHILSTLTLLSALFFTISFTLSVFDFFHDYKIMQAQSEGKIRVGCYQDYVGENYEAVVEQLHILGLNNIETINLDHFCIFPFHKGTVDSIYINGISDFGDDYFVYPDVQVIIRYL